MTQLESDFDLYKQPQHGFIGGTLAHTDKD
jgi:hypothetical protein